MLYFAGQVGPAFETLDRYLASDSTDYEVLWRAARAAVVLGVAEERMGSQNEWLDPAIVLSERALALRPHGIDGLYWHGVAAGRRALNAKSDYAARLVQVVYDDAHAILALDSLHGGAHNMLGKLNYEVMSLSRVKRAMARLFMGNQALSDASWENARHHLTRAAELWPDYVLFHFDLAQFYRKRGPEEEAIRSFRRAIDLPTVHPIDVGLRADAQTRLDGMTSR